MSVIKVIVLIFEVISSCSPSHTCRRRQRQPHEIQAADYRRGGELRTPDCPFHGRNLHVGRSQRWAVDIQIVTLTYTVKPQYSGRPFKCVEEDCDPPILSDMGNGLCAWGRLISQMMKPRGERGLTRPAEILIPDLRGSLNVESTSNAFRRYIDMTVGG